MYIADMLSRAYLQVDRTQCQRTPEYQIFQLKQEQQLFEEIANINQVDYMRLSEGTHQQIKQCTLADPTLQILMNTVTTGWPVSKEDVPPCIRSIVQRNEGHCSHFHETSDDCQSPFQSLRTWCLCTSSTWCVILAEYVRPNQGTGSKLWSLQWLSSQTTEGTVNDA